MPAYWSQRREGHRNPNYLLSCFLPRIRQSILGMPLGSISPYEWRITCETSIHPTSYAPLANLETLETGMTLSLSTLFHDC